VGQHHVGWLPLPVVVLATADWGNMRGDSSVDDEVLFPRILVDRDPADDLEPAAEMDLA
jgi:hypothetical protein